MESLMILVLVIAAVLAVFIKGAADERVKQRRQKRKIHEGFGAVPDRDYSDEELSSIPGYFSMHQEPEQVDDITWNDLGMDQLFFRMNQTYSSAGQEYLYYLLDPAAERCKGAGRHGRKDYLLRAAGADA